MIKHELHDGRLAVEVRQDRSKMIMTFDRGSKCVLMLSLEEVRDLKEALQRMEEEMIPRAEAKDAAVAMAKDLHAHGWTFKTFSDAMHPMNGITTDMVLGDIGDELSRLDKGDGQ